MTFAWCFMASCALRYHNAGILASRSRHLATVSFSMLTFPESCRGTIHVTSRSYNSKLMATDPSQLDEERQYLVERLLTTGSELLEDHELLEFLLSAARPHTPIGELARLLLSRFRTFPRVIKAPVWELLAVEGLGPVGAATLKSVEVAALRVVRAEVVRKPVIGSMGRWMAYLHAELYRENKQQLRAMFFNERGRLLAHEVVQEGTLNHVAFYPRKLVKLALDHHASAFITVHNHPSGDAKATFAEFTMYEEVKKAAAALSIDFMDHVIIANGCYYSLRNRELVSSPVGWNAPRVAAGEAPTRDMNVSQEPVASRTPRRRRPRPQPKPDAS
jgi:DNA repair protein RadC